MKKLIVATALMAVSTISFADHHGGSHSAVVGDAAKGATAYATCAGCHGAGGEGMEAAGYPALRGHTAEYISEQLHAFKSGKRVNPTMNAMAQMLATDQDVADVAAYIAKFK